MSELSRYGRWTVIGDAPRSAAGRRCVTCQCDCGAVAVVALGNLTSGTSRSCGCLRAEVRAAGAVTVNNRREFSSWACAKSRCFNPRMRAYPRYGGRGISMHPAWRDDFTAFLAYMGPCPEGHSLDRINNDGDYEPGNVRWADARTQRLNARNVVRFRNLDDAVLSLKDVARELAMSEMTLARRFRRAGVI